MAIAAHKGCITADIKLAQQWNAHHNPNTFETTKRAKKTMRRIKRPHSTPIDIFSSTYDTPNNTIVTGEREVINTINTHWKKTFEKLHTPDPIKLATWLNAFPRKFTSSNIEDWLPTVEDILQVIQSSSNSAPGPDRIPFEGFKPIKDYAAPILHLIIKEMFFNPDWTPPHTSTTPGWSCYQRNPRSSTQH